MIKLLSSTAQCGEDCVEMVFFFFKHTTPLNKIHEKPYKEGWVIASIEIYGPWF